MKSVDFFCVCVTFFSTEKPPFLRFMKPSGGSDQVLINAVKRIVYLPVLSIWSHLFV